MTIMQLVQITPSSVAVQDGWGPVEDATLTWLASKSPNTREAYGRDLRKWNAFCKRRGVDELQARKQDADLFGAWLQDLNNGEALSATSAARTMAAISSWYKYLIACNLHDRNPFGAAERPHVDRDYSPTAWLDQDGAQALIACAQAQTGPTRLRDIAMIRLMLQVGIRVSEVCALKVSSLGTAKGQRVLNVTGKGGKRTQRALPDSTWAALEAYLEERCRREGCASIRALPGTLFVTGSGRPVDRVDAFRLVRRLAARAGLPEQVTPHGLRHSFATLATQAGADLDDLQDAMGHADPRTTRRYQRAARRLERDPAHLVAAALG